MMPSYYGDISLLRCKIIVLIRLSCFDFWYASFLFMPIGLLAVSAYLFGLIASLAFTYFLAAYLRHRNTYEHIWFIRLMRLEMGL